MDGTESSMDHSLPVLKILDSSLRISVIPLAVASIWITMTNQEDNSSYGLLKYNTISGLKYMVWISAICASYAAVAAVVSWIRCSVSKAWIFFISDQIMAYLMVTSGAAVLEISYLSYKGDIEVSWSEACSSYGRFCRKMQVAWFFHELALCCFFVLAVISAYRTFRIFEPPVYSQEVEESRT